MAAQADLKSTAITNLDASPTIRPTAGQEGGEATVFRVTGIAGPTTSGATTGGVLQMVRIPTNAVGVRVWMCQEAATTTATFDAGLYYSDADDGTPAILQGTAFDADCFASSYDSHATITPAEVSFLATTYLATDLVNPIWAMASAGNTSNPAPGGFFDVCLTNTATISGAATLVVTVEYSIASG